MQAAWTAHAHFYLFFYFLHLTSIHYATVQALAYLTRIFYFKCCNILYTGWLQTKKGVQVVLCELKHNTVELLKVVFRWITLCKVFFLYYL